MLGILFRELHLTVYLFIFSPFVHSVLFVCLFSSKVSCLGGVLVKKRSPFTNNLGSLIYTFISVLKFNKKE